MRTKILSGFVCCLLLFSFNALMAQCEDESFLDNCASSLKDNTFLKAYKVSSAQAPKPNGKEFSYVFSKGTDYTLIVCQHNESGSKMIANIYDRNKKLVASSYDKRTKTHFPALAYTCKATGVYYIRFMFDEDKPGCGVSIMGFKK